VVNTQAQTPQNASSAQGGPGTFNLDQPAIGLDKLPGYKNSLVSSFKGTLDGKDYQTSATSSRSVTVSPADFVAEMDYSASDANAFHLLTGKIGDQQLYKPSKDAPCQTTVEASSDGLGDIPDPVLQLYPIKGAEQVGDETLGEIAATHYKFDQRALQLTQGTADGNFWVAKEGGWVVKYSLHIQAPAGVLGAKMAGEQTLEYQAAPIQTVSLPEGCTAALDGYPQLDDAQDVVRMNGAIHYTSAKSLKEAVDFYESKMTAAGWGEQKGFTASAEQAVLTFTKAGEKDQKTAAIALRVKSGVLSVDIQEITTALPSKTTTPSAGLTFPLGIPNASGTPQIPGMPQLPITLPTQ
jgi:hypothetical protein